MDATSAPVTASAPVPVVPPVVVRRLIVGVVWAFVAVSLIATGIVVLSGHSEWWTPLGCSVITALLCAAASVGILSMAAGRTVDWLVTFVMAVAAARLFVSVIGLIVAVKVFHAADNATGLLVCVFYVVTLVVETTQLYRTVAAPAGGTHA